jgi:hypothetical protein
MARINYTAVSPDTLKQLVEMASAWADENTEMFEGWKNASGESEAVNAIGDAAKLAAGRAFPEAFAGADFEITDPEMLATVAYMDAMREIFFDLAIGYGMAVVIN